MLTPARLGAALRDLAEFTWVCLDSREDAVQVAHAAAIPVEIILSPAVGWRVAEAPRAGAADVAGGAQTDEATSSEKSE